MGIHEWPEWMITMEPGDATHGTYGYDTVSCNTQHCAIGWVAVSFQCELYEVFCADAHTPVARFVATLAQEMGVKQKTASAVEARFEGFRKGPRMTNFEFAAAWNRSIRKHGYNITFDRPARFR